MKAETPGPKTRYNTKFMQTLSPRLYRKLEAQGELRGIGVQQLIRVVIIPDWMSRNGLLNPKPVTVTVKPRLRSPDKPVQP